ncbi:unnamed protein product [Lymnaea stagnalis]|uniref:Large subunit GTPase 1 homolog n=1 Tax=Lymnaea stagnalis TaxID=6523 RepID=A0AAV2IC54_LYMST
MGRRKGQIALMSNSLLVKDKNKKLGRRPIGNESFLHTTELDDGTSYNRINFQSVTEQNNLEDFLTTAEMAGKDFTAERQNIEIISSPGQHVRLTDEALKKISDAQDTHKELLQIPRRPKWDAHTTKEQLELMERETFTNWRRQLKLLEEKEHIQLTPYEKNLDFWRQLWRVIERSDVVVQIVDARNPLLFRCADLDAYVKEVDARKTSLLLINKADFLNVKQREQWVEYFNKEGITAVFFSAKVEKDKKEGTTETEAIDSEDEEVSEDDDDDDEEDEVNEENDSEDMEDKNSSTLSNSQVQETTSTERVTDICQKQLSNISLDTPENSKENENQLEPANLGNSDNTSADALLHNKPDIVEAHELLAIFHKLAKPSSDSREDDVKTVGMVGYPNVGKSSTINVILEEKRLAVSATPGKTKHLQTLYVDPHLMLCDCPGLVFPSFVATKAHLVVNGILPIDELRDHISPVTLVCDRIPRIVFESTYSIMIPRPSLDEADSDRKPTAEELLNAYGGMRGFMTARGTPDGPRASRYILKDYVKGKLLYCEPPPGISGSEFQDKERLIRVEEFKHSKILPRQMRSDVDKEFFEKKQSQIHAKGVHGLKPPSLAGQESADGQMGSQTSINSVAGKPWKRHNNRNKKEKLRRLHRDLDVYN